MACRANLCWIAALLLVACGSAGEPQVSDAMVPSVDAGISRVTGSYTLDYHANGTVEQQPVDLSGVTIAAWVPYQDGTYKRINGEGFSDGTFVIDLVPERLVYVQVDAVYVGTASRYIDLGSDVIGRADRTIASGGTKVTFDVDNLRLWSPDDTLTFFSANLGANLYLEYDAVPEIPIGSTGLAAIEFDWRYYLVDGDKGDRGALYQFAEGNAGGIRYTKPIRVFDIPAFVQTNAATTVVSGSFADIPQDKTLSIFWNVAAYAFQSRDVNTAAIPLFGELGLYAAAPGTSPTSRWNRPQLVNFPFLFGNEPVDISNLAYGDVHPATWPRYISASLTFYVEYTLPGAKPGPAFADIIYSIERDQLTDDTVTIKMSPVSSVRVNDAPGQVDRFVVTTTPTISWTAPSIGVAPTGYRVDVLLARIDQGETRFDFGPRFFTTATSLTLPPGVIDQDQSFVLRVAAIWAPNQDLSSAPRRQTLPYAISEALSGLLTP